jgi:chromosome segregation ATPase
MALENATAHLTDVVDRLEGALATRLKELESTVAALKAERDELVVAAQAVPPVIEADPAAMSAFESQRDAAVAELAACRETWATEKSSFEAKCEASANEAASALVSRDRQNDLVEKLTTQKAEMTSTLHDALQTVDSILASLKGKVAL